MKWKSSNRKIATVSSNGRVRGVAPGKTVIKAKNKGKTYSCKVTVKNSIKADQKSLSLREGNRKKVKITAHAGKSISYSIADPSIVSCTMGIWSGQSVNLTMKGLKAGTTTVTVKNNFTKQKIKIKVTVSGKSTSNTSSVSSSSGSDESEDPELVIDLPVLPQRIYNYASGGSTLYRYGDVTNIRIEEKYHSSSDTFTVYLYFDGEMEYNYRGNNESSSLKIAWKLWKGDTVVDSGTVYSPSIAPGEKFSEAREIVSNVKPGTYTLTLLSTN